MLDSRAMSASLASLESAAARHSGGGEGLAALCKAAGDSLRLRILRVLRQDSFGVLELCALFGMRQPALSHHLKVLASAGLVSGRREGNAIYYRRAGADAGNPLAGLRRCLFEAIDELPLSAGLRAGLAELQRERVRSSEAFFRLNADRFREQQELIAGYERYADAAAELLGGAALPGRALALEVGPGDGRFLRELAPAFRRVIALDNSAQMLERARELARRRLPNVEFVLGDASHPPLREAGADCIVANMVLHHTPSPDRVLRELANCLAPGGRLLVSELCEHEQAWAREVCGDLWLGFRPGDLGAWAAAAGLEEVAGVYLAQRNGFRLQVRLFGRAGERD